MRSGPEGDPRRSSSGETRGQALLNYSISRVAENAPAQEGMSDTVYKMHGIQVPPDSKKRPEVLDEMPCMGG